MGGVGREAILRQDDDSLIRCVREELRAIAGITATPRYVEVNRWERAMPQYVLGHVDLIGRIEGAMSRFGGLALTGAAYRGVGIPDCIRDATTAATALMEYLTHIIHGGSSNNEVRDATNKERHVCARARDGERPVSSSLVDAGESVSQIGRAHV